MMWDRGQSVIHEMMQPSEMHESGEAITRRTLCVPKPRWGVSELFYIRLGNPHKHRGSDQTHASTS